MHVCYLNRVTRFTHCFSPHKTLVRMFEPILHSVKRCGFSHKAAAEHNKVLTHFVERLTLKYLTHILQCPPLGSPVSGLSCVRAKSNWEDIFTLFPTMEGKRGSSPNWLTYRTLNSLCCGDLREVNLSAQTASSAV